MSEFIGSRISLISKSDIRYVGTLHEINSESSTVALESVVSFGTEGRRSNPDEEIPGTDSTYDYIVFRGSDVKDLRIEQPPKENNPPPPPQVPNDPAILGSGTRPQPSNGPPQQHMPPDESRNGNFPPGPQFQHHQNGPGHFPGHHQYGGLHGGPHGLPHDRPYGRPGFGGPSPRGYEGYPGPHYPPPPGWHGPPPPGSGFPGQHVGPFPPRRQGDFPYGGPGPQQQAPQRPPQQQPQSQSPPERAPNESSQPTKILERPNGANQPPQRPKSQQPKGQTPTPAPGQAPSQAPIGPPPPVASKPDPAAALAPAAPASNTVPNANTQKSGKIVPAVPRPSTTRKAVNKPNPNFPINTMPANLVQQNPPKPSQAATNAALQHQSATTQAAAAAVAAAMAKLGPGPSGNNAGITAREPRAAGGGGDIVDNLTKKVNEMRTHEGNRQPRAGRGTGRGGGGRGGAGAAPRGIEVPSSDFDFESANAKFNKQDLVKEAIATGDVGVNGDSPADGLSKSKDETGENGEKVVIPAATGAGEGTYNKSSFFDNLSSEAKERDDTAEGGNGGKPRPRGFEFRNEDRKRNMETFGISNVDGGGYRGRGRGRGRGGFGRGGGYGRGGPGGGGRGESGGLGFVNSGAGAVAGA